MAVSLTLAGLFAAPNTGVIKSGTLPVPGATITATLDAKKVVTTTDDQGVYTFPDLDTGVWKMTVEMLGFATVTRDIPVAPEAPGQEWDLKLLSAEDLTTALATKAAAVTAAEAAAVPAAAPAAPTPAAPVTSATAPTPAAGTTTANATPAPNGRGGTPAAANGRGARGGQTATGRGQTGTQAAGRGQTANGGRGATTANGRPSLLGAYQEVGVSQSSESSSFNQEGNISSEQTAQLSQSADQSFVVQGSQSTAMGMGGNPDFGGGFGGKHTGEAALEAARLRLRPILMTSFAFLLGVLPLAFSSGAGAVARRVMGTAVMGGTAAASLIAVFLIPVTFYVVGKVSGRAKKKDPDKTTGGSHE